MPQGCILLVRDGWIVDGIWPYSNEKERVKASAEAHRKHDHYQFGRYLGSWTVRDRRMSKRELARNLKSYCRALGF